MSFHLETLLSTEATWDNLNGPAEAEMKPISSLHCSCIKCSVQLSFFGLIDSVNFNIFIFFINFLVTLFCGPIGCFFPVIFFYFAERHGIAYWKECIFVFLQHYFMLFSTCICSGKKQYVKNSLS